MTVQRSASWSNFTVHHFSKCYRTPDKPFAAWLEAVGNGTAPTVQNQAGGKGYVELKNIDRTFDATEALNWCFSNIADPWTCAHQRVLATTNAAVDEFSTLALDKLTSQHRLQEYWAHSADSINLDEGLLFDEMSQEFLHMQDSHGAPPHALRLVPGALYEVMRNLAPAEKLMNRTKVVLHAVHAHRVEVRRADGKILPVPRICFQWALGRGTAQMTRRQYPLRPAYSCTYNGAQGETLTRCVIDLRQPAFAHGHLYVALGRVATRKDLKCLAAPELCSSTGVTLAKNVVWPELLIAESGPRTHGSAQTLVLKRPAAAAGGTSRFVPKRRNTVSVPMIKNSP